MENQEEEDADDLMEEIDLREAEDRTDLAEPHDDAETDYHCYCAVYNHPDHYHHHRYHHVYLNGPNSGTGTLREWEAGIPTLMRGSFVDVLDRP